MSYATALLICGNVVSSLFTVFENQIRLVIGNAPFFFLCMLLLSTIVLLGVQKQKDKPIFR